MASTGWGNLNWYVVNGEEDALKVSESVAGILETVFETRLRR